MEKKRGAGKGAAWLGLGLGALALFLVVYTQWLGPSIEANRAEAKEANHTEAEARESKKQSEERLQTYQDFRNSGVLEEYASGEKAVDVAAASEESREALVNRFNESSTHTLYGRNLVTDSIELLDLYFCDHYMAIDDPKPDSANLVARYRADCVGEMKVVIATYYDLPEKLYNELVFLCLAQERPLPVLIGYLYEYRDDIQYGGTYISYYDDEGLGRVIKMGQDNGDIYYDADTFLYEIGITSDQSGTAIQGNAGMKRERACCGRRFSFEKSPATAGFFSDFPFFVALWGGMWYAVFSISPAGPGHLICKEATRAMDKIRLGKTELMVSKTAFGALPIQRIPKADAVRLVRKAYDSGINYFDTANAYTDSEEKLGEAFEGIRQNVIISTKSGGGDKKTVQGHIEESLRRLKTDYIDLFQFHNPAKLPDPNDPDGPFAAALEAKEKGYIRHIGITNHRLAVANAAVDSGNFETMQFPFCYLADQKDLELLRKCEAADMGFIAMKGLSGGMLNNAAACYAFMAQYPHVVPIWGIQHEWELDQWLELTEKNQQMTPELQAVIDHDRKELAQNFCRSCGYCLPCAAGIDIPQAARMAMLLRRSPYKPYMSDEWYAKMHKIEDCIHCNACKSRCPYGLDTPALLQIMLKDYDQFYAEHHND